MSTSDIRTIGIVGAGQMGGGIAQVFASQGRRVLLMDVDTARVEAGVGAIAQSLDRFVKKGSLSAADRDAVLGRIQGVTGLEALAPADFVIEAATEREELKKEIFRTLDAVTRPEVCLASNTSSISITRLAAVTKRPDRVIGMHFMNPVPLMKLVELIRGLATSEETVALTAALSAEVGKETVLASDHPGFIVNRVLMPMINEACFALMQGVGSVEDIDTAMKLGTNQPMGPLLLADFIGLDTCLAILRVLEEGLGDRYKPCALLRQYVDAGWLGRKTGRGFYAWDGGKAVTTRG